MWCVCTHLSNCRPCLFLYLSSLAFSSKLNLKTGQLLAFDCQGQKAVGYGFNCVLSTPFFHWSLSFGAREQSYCVKSHLSLLSAQFSLISKHSGVGTPFQGHISPIRKFYIYILHQFTGVLLLER